MPFLRTLVVKDFYLELDGVEMLHKPFSSLTDLTVLEDWSDESCSEMVAVIARFMRLRKLSIGSLANQGCHFYTSKDVLDALLGSQSTCYETLEDLDLFSDRMDLETLFDLAVELPELRSLKAPCFHDISNSEAGVQDSLSNLVTNKTVPLHTLEFFDISVPIFEGDMMLPLFSERSPSRLIMRILPPVLRLLLHCATEQAKTERLVEFVELSWRHASCDMDINSHFLRMRLSAFSCYHFVIYQSA
ncbi:hypothetical protein HDU85_001630 [Gaertneriomyces sp. JEL0708]|nr:hypothetical protein HDU85_001630 [Gaertneriomyces sp. JEL0708]